MLDGRNLVVDTFSDVYAMLKPWIDHEFWDLSQHKPIANSIYVIGRKQCVEQQDLVHQMALDPQYRVVFANSAEGSSTQIAQLKALKLEQLVLDKKILLLTGGDLPPEYPHLLHEHFLLRILAYDENLQEMKKIDDIFSKLHKPYKFLFLNGRARPHRKYLWERLRLTGLLDQALWTMLDGRGTGYRTLSLKHNGTELLSTNTPIQHLPPQYEVDRYRNNTATSSTYPHQFVKFDIFNNEWGEIYLESAPYIDTYFSLVTETVLECPYSFRTEKIAKVLAMGHPWICATNSGFYRDMRNMGFQTFHTLIDETFDQIENSQDRIDRVFAVVKDLCQSDLPAFLAASRSICKYNQQRLHELVEQEISTFPDRFFNFIEQHNP
jgi:hypothetical protein